MSKAKVTVEDTVTGQIERGLVIYLGVGKEDTEEDLEWLAKKIVQLRIFSDEAGKMNRSVMDVEGGLLIISQFTLFASTKKGNRPSYLNSGSPDIANELYETFTEHIQKTYSVPVGKGVFGADMKVSYTNDGPVTIVMDTKNKE